MEDIIHLLPDSVANQIAAGEVVQRPASIVKEMVENSIDAEAADIQVIIVDGGKTSIQIIDDGKGMSETDARMAFERHATSKIHVANDLFALTTMGFRGEALASIAAVAQVELKTRRAEDETGTYIQLAGSKVTVQEPVACPVGSNFSVNNLFFNIPARRKFLKGNQTELTNIIAEFERIALAHPDVAFKLLHNGTVVYDLPKTTLRQRIAHVFGKNISQQLLPMEVETSLVKISGYIGTPDSARKKGAKQFFFVNGRFMRHPYFHVAVCKAYEQLVQTGDHPHYFIYMSVNPSTIDVNVHPTKTEIKFDNEQDIWQVLSALVRETLGRSGNVPTIDFDVEGKPDIPVFVGGNRAPATLPHKPSASYNPFQTTGKPAYQRQETNWEPLYSGLSTHTHSQDDTVSQTSQMEFWSLDDSQNQKQEKMEYDCFQYQGRFIVTPHQDGLMMLDQHRAHICILYDEYLRKMKHRKNASQQMLFPEIVQFTRTEALVVENVMKNIESIGFELTNLGGGAYSVNGVPSGIEGVNYVDLLHQLVAAATDNTGQIEGEVSNRIALAMARASAIVDGQVLSKPEMEDIIDKLLRLDHFTFTPEGKKVMNIIPSGQIDKMF